MIEGFLGHLLCWGQMSYWGITVMINIVAVLPCCGNGLGIIGFPRRIYDYSMIFFKFQWFNSLGLIGIYLSIIILLFTFYPLFACVFLSILSILIFAICRNPIISNVLIRWAFIGSSLVEVLITF